MIYPTQFDVIVVGGGRRQEAALAAARMGRAITLFAQPQYRDLGADVVQPVDWRHRQRPSGARSGRAGRAMALATDMGGIQFRTLNSSKGRRCAPPAPGRPRAPTRRPSAICWKTRTILMLFQQPVDDLLLDGDRVAG